MRVGYEWARLPVLQKPAHGFFVSWDNFLPVFGGKIKVFLHRERKRGKVMALTEKQKKFIDNNFKSFSHLAERNYMTDAGVYDVYRMETYRYGIRELEQMHDSETLMQDVRCYVVDSLDLNPKLEKQMYDWYTYKRLFSNQIQSMDEPDGPRLFVDMDGTLYRFHDAILDEEGHVQLEKMYEPEFFENLEWFATMMTALVYLHEEYPNLEIYILSSADNHEIVAQKNRCIDRDLPFIDSKHRLFPKTWQNKADVIPFGIQPEDMLVDDYNVNLRSWKEAGGISVKFINNINHKGIARFGGDYGHLWKGPTVDYRFEAVDIKNRILKFMDNEKNHQKAADDFQR